MGQKLIKNTKKRGYENIEKASINDDRHQSKYVGIIFHLIEIMMNLKLAFSHEPFLAYLVVDANLTSKPFFSHKRLVPIKEKDRDFIKGHTDTEG